VKVTSSGAVPDVGVVAIKVAIGAAPKTVAWIMAVWVVAALTGWVNPMHTMITITHRKAKGTLCAFFWAMVGSCMVSSRRSRCLEQDHYVVRISCSERFVRRLDMLI